MCHAALMTATELPIAGDERAHVLLAADRNALLIGMVLDQWQR